jgi:hypothetical protein
MEPLARSSLVENRRIRGAGCVYDHCVPKGDLSQPVKFDGGNHVAFREPHQTAPREDLNLALRDGRIHSWFPGGRHEILLEHL